MTGFMASNRDPKAVPPTLTSKSDNAEDVMPAPNYTKLSETLRKSTNQQLLCNMFCGGRKCKYEWPDNWSDQQKAVPGVYSHWITDDVLAMARPNTENINKYNLIKHFHQFNIKSIINLQEPGEHSSCGNSLTPSGFSYEPTLFMENQVYFYNFQWKDYSIVSDEVLLDMVKVLTFALTEGRVAVHCHAGLGRTGVLIASYLVFTFRCKPQEAIRWVRSKRPNSIQTRGQILSVMQFSQYVVPFFVVYQHIISRQIGLSLWQVLYRQRYLLHGYELRHLRYIPKIIYILCERLLKLCRRHKVYSPGINRQSNRHLRRDVAINYQLSESESFSKYFFSSVISGAELIRYQRPDSNHTIDETSGIVSPEEDFEDLDNFSDNTINQHKNDSKSKSVELSGICSESKSSVLPPVEVMAHIGNGSPLSVSVSGNGLQSSEDIKTGSSYSLSSDEPLESSMSESLTSIIESLGYGVLKIDSSQMVYEKEFEFLNNHNMENKSSHLILNETDDKVMDDIDNYFEDIEDHHCSSGFVSSNCGNSTEDEDHCQPIDPKLVIEALVNDPSSYAKPIRQSMFAHQKELNTKSSGWNKLSHETNVQTLAGLLWSWIDNLSEPVLTKNSLCYIVLKAEKPLEGLIKLDQTLRYTVEYLLRFIARLNPDEQNRNILIRCLFARLTRQRFRLMDGRLVPEKMDWPEMRKGTAGRICLFAEGIVRILVSDISK